MPSLGRRASFAARRTRNRPRRRRIILHFGGSAGGDHAPVVQHGDVIGDGHHHVHVVLDQDDRDAAVRQQADQRLEVLDLAMREAGRRLVEQQQPRLERERPRDLEAALVAEGQIARLLGRVVGEADEIQQLARLRKERALFTSEPRQPQQRFGQRAAVVRVNPASTFSSTVICPNSSVF